ncbi:hypothetical protein P280DRAFT_120723 [Massarina eburnea CBS 473.64]|uniref:Uncharacterized protein n=1 Tax=Massarina eburnea CBS 473.64 TaxID=1395130 RepID=A0A6A6SEE1_9PLEO|nr:hypothetical protein P280DRAFT_120723 [Massarina eburnea CBS 473.64]
MAIVPFGGRETMTGNWAIGEPMGLGASTACEWHVVCSAKRLFEMASIRTLPLPASACLCLPLSRPTSAVLAAADDVLLHPLLIIRCGRRAHYHHSLSACQLVTLSPLSIIAFIRASISGPLFALLGALVATGSSTHCTYQARTCRATTTYIGAIHLVFV